MQMPPGATEVTKMSEGRQVGTVANEQTSVPAKAGSHYTAQALPATVVRWALNGMVFYVLLKREARNLCSYMKSSNC